MFRDVIPFSSFSVDDLDAARRFYGETLGLDVSEQEMGGLSIRLAGGGQLYLYPKPNHEPASFTVLNFPTTDLEGTVGRLKQAGVRFERYDEPDLKTDDDSIVRGTNGPQIAWFKDPAGNIISVVNR